jgi:glycosyltransferase involved in cell wall biosynthesis
MKKGFKVLKILFLAWKDIQHPTHGGAEVVLHELAKRLAKAGNEVTILTAAYDHAPAQTILDGIHVIRVGRNRYLHPFQALRYYRKHLRHKFDVVIETVNTAPYFHVFSGDSAKSFLMYHQLAREIWFHESFAPISHLGYWLLEPIATWLLGKSKTKTITVSESTKRDLQRFGFTPDQIAIISEGIPIVPIKNLDNIKKFDKPTILSHGSIRAMKRTLDQIKAFEIAKKQIPELQLKISGNAEGVYGKKILAYIAQSPYRNDIEYCGRTTDEEKIELMQKCHAIIVTSLKEGWGIIVTEAASQGAPAVVYDVDGLRDSVRSGITGIVTATNSEALASGIVTTLQDESLYRQLRRQAWEWSKQITFDRSYKDFVKIVGGIHD